MLIQSRKTYLGLLQSLKMSGILQDRYKDLYDQILQNPDYLTSQSRLVQSFLAKLTKETIIKCHFCAKQIKEFHLISQGKHCYCIVCFSHIILENKQPYLVINLSKKAQSQSSLNLAQQLRMVNVIKEYGIEHEKVRNIDLSDLSIFKKSLKDTKETQNMVDHTDAGNQDKMGSLLFNQYNVNDFVLAYMHEKTNPKLNNFIIQRKSLEQKQKEQMIRDVEKICKSQNDQAEIDQESELSIDNDKINIDTKDILKQGQKMLKKMRLFIQKDQSKQKKISKIRKFKANRIIRQTKVDSQKHLTSKIRRSKAKVYMKK